MESKRKNVYITIFVITTIIASCTAVYFYLKANNSKIPQNNLSESSNESKDEIKLNNENSKEFDIYSKYSFIKWATNNDKFENNLQVNIVDNTKVAFYYNDKKEKELDLKIGNIKSVMGISNGGMFQAYVLLDNGEVAIANFTEDKVIFNNALKNYNIKIVDMGKTEESLVECCYFLTSDGNLVNIEGFYYEQINRDFVKKYGNLGNTIYEDKDGKLYHYESSANYKPIIDEDNNMIKAENLFFQSSSTRNDILSKGVSERAIIITKDNKLYYHDNSNVYSYQVKPGKIVQKFEIKEIIDDYGGKTKNCIITMDDMSVIEIVDVM